MPTLAPPPQTSSFASPLENIDFSRITPDEAKQRELAWKRLEWVKDNVYLPQAANDAVATQLAPNMEFSIGDYHKFQAVEKGRKMAHSFAFALDALARAATEPKSVGIMISTDKEEAQEKNRYTEMIFDALRPSMQRHLKMTGGKQQKTYATGAQTRFYPCRQPRGPGACVYLDEFAYMRMPNDILKAARACTTHAGYIRMASTHQGKGTDFYQIVNNEPDESGRKPHSAWHVGTFQWWWHPALCRDIPAAIYEAPLLETVDRVEKFGTPRLQEQFASYPLEEFQEEFECIVLDEAYAYYSLKLIQSCQPKLDTDYWFERALCDVKSPDALSAGKEAVNLLSAAIKNGVLTGEWYWGMDIGRHHDLSEIIVGHTLPEDKKHVCVRLNISLNRIPFPKQREMIDYLLKHIPILQGHMDAHGLGEMLSEECHKAYGQRAMPFKVNNPEKATLAAALRTRMEKSKLSLPTYADLSKQIHSIRKKVSASGNAIFDTDAGEKHHADKWFALCLMNVLVELPTGRPMFMPTVMKQERLPSRLSPGGLVLPPRFGR